MHVAAIITEYNPFHRGHAYQLTQIDADFIVVIMSGNYVQRGEPALVDKWTRAEMALAAGVDLVLELPTAVATGSAEYFARGAVFLLEQSQVVNQLCFGAEHSEIHDLQTIAEILLNESPEFSVLLQNSLKAGNSYAHSRQKALETLFPERPYSKILKGSNNILAIEYLKALLSCHSPIQPHLILRQGQDYLDKSYQPDIFMSATAIRDLLHQNQENPELKGTLPNSSYQSLVNAIAGRKAPISPADIYPFLRITLLQLSDSELLQRREIHPDLLNRMLNALHEKLDYEDFVAACASRNFPIAKVKRTLLYLFLNQVHPQPLTSENSYLKILGFRQSAAPLLKLLRKQAALPVITNTRNVKSLSLPARFHYFNELRYDKLYAEIVYQKYGTVLPAPEKRTPIILT